MGRTEAIKALIEAEEDIVRDLSSKFDETQRSISAIEASRDLALAELDAEFKVEEHLAKSGELPQQDLDAKRRAWEESRAKRQKEDDARIHAIAAEANSTFVPILNQTRHLARAHWKMLPEAERPTLVAELSAKFKAQ